MKKAVFATVSLLRRWSYAAGMETLIKKIPFATAFFRILYGRVKPDGIAIAAVRDFGFQMYVDPLDKWIGSMLLTSGRYDPFESQVFSSLIHRGMTVVDVGAHAGYYTLLAASRVGDLGRVFSFEPAPENYNLLLKNLSLNGVSNVFPQKKALFDRIGKCSFFLASENLGHHGIFTGRDGESVESEIEVETTTLDEFLSGRNETIDVIKMDAEGAEPMILRGMEGTLLRCDKLALFTEFNPHNLLLGNCSPQGFLADLEAHGFVLHKLDEESRIVSRAEINHLMETCSDQPDTTTNLLCLKGRAL